MWDYQLDDSFSTPEASCIDDCVFIEDAAESTPLDVFGADEGRSPRAYFRERELLGLLTPARSPGLMQRGSLYDPDHSGGSSSSDRPSVATSGKVKDCTSTALGSILSPDSHDFLAGRSCSSGRPSATLSSEAKDGTSMLLGSVL